MKYSSATLMILLGAMISSAMPIVTKTEVIESPEEYPPAYIDLEVERHVGNDALEKIESKRLLKEEVNGDNGKVEVVKIYLDPEFTPRLYKPKQPRGFEKRSLSKSDIKESATSRTIGNNPKVRARYWVVRLSIPGSKIVEEPGSDSQSEDDDLFVDLQRRLFEPEVEAETLKLANEFNKDLHRSVGEFEKTKRYRRELSPDERSEVYTDTPDDYELSFVLNLAENQNLESLEQSKRKTMRVSQRDVESGADTEAEINMLYGPRGRHDGNDNSNMIELASDTNDRPIRLDIIDMNNLDSREDVNETGTDAPFGDDEESVGFAKALYSVNSDGRHSSLA